MRLAFLTHEPFHPPSGGGSAEAPYLIRELVRRGHRVHLFGPAFPDSTAVAARFGITFHPFERWQMGRYTRLRNLKYLLYPTALAGLVRDTIAECGRREAGFRFDVLLAQHTISAVAAGRLRRELQCPVVFNFLDYLTGFMETWPAWVMPSPVVRALTRFELSLPRRFHADGVLTVSTPLAERFIATGLAPDRVKAIRYGFDAAHFTPGPTPPPDRNLWCSCTASSTNTIWVALPGSPSDALPMPDRTPSSGLSDAKPPRWAAFCGMSVPRIRDPARADGIRSLSRSCRSDSPGHGRTGPVRGIQRHALRVVAKAVEYLGCGIPVASTPLENLSRYFRDELAIRFSSDFSGPGLAAAILAWLETPEAERRRLGLLAAERVARELDWSRVTAAAVDFVEGVVGRSAWERVQARDRIAKPASGPGEGH